MEKIAALAAVLLTLVALAENPLYTILVVLFLAILPIVAVVVAPHSVKNAVALMATFGSLAGCTLIISGGSLLGQHPEGNSALFQGIALPLVAGAVGVGGCLFFGISSSSDEDEKR